MTAPRCYWFPPVPRPEASPPDLTSLLHTLLLEQTSQSSELRVRLDDALDGREAAESQLEKTRAWIARWGLATELDLEMPYRRPDGPRRPSSTHRDRPDGRDAEVLLLRRELEAAREAEHRAFRIAERERDRSVAAEEKIDELRDEVSRLRAALDF